jgi:hypothetical protein
MSLLDLPDELLERIFVEARNAEDEGDPDEGEAHPLYPLLTVCRRVSVSRRVHRSRVQLSRIG